jgi:hypothetical protein
MVRAFLIAALSMAALSGCAASSYAGIGLAPGAADPGVQALARQAMDGDKPAQLKLGLLYEQAADGIIALEPDDPADPGRIEDIRAANEIFRIGTGSRDLEKYGGWRLLAMTRAGSLYKSAAAHSGKEGLSGAGTRLSAIEDAIFRERFVTRFNDPNDEICQDSYSYDDWRREAHFIVEGRLSYRFVRQPERSASESWVDWEKRHYEAAIDIERFVKWPDKFPKPAKLSFVGDVVEGQLVDTATGDRRGCRTWGPDGAADGERAIVVLQYRGAPVGAGGFEIVRTIKAGSGG